MSTLLRFPLRRPLALALLGLAGLLLAGCQNKAKQAPPTLAVQTVVIQTRPMTHYEGFLGTVTPLQTAQIIPQTSGMLSGVHFLPGGVVHKGQLLFTINPDQARAALAQAQAKVAADLATASYNQKLVDQDRPLVAKDFITRQSYDQAVSQAEAAAAQVQADRAAVQQAALNLSYTRITAPISGRIGQAQVKAGNLVVANQTVLTTINQIQPIAINFSVPQNLLDAARAAQATAAPLPVLDESSRQQIDRARLIFVDNTVGAGTGTVVLQASAANAQLALWPGQYVLVQMPVQHLAVAPVLPVGAIQQGPKGAYVYVVAAGKAETRPVDVLWEETGSAVVQGLPTATPIIYPVPTRVYPGAPVKVAPAAAKTRKGAQPAPEAQP
jgi:multidrug efflux system membrane fusion protein